MVPLAAPTLTVQSQVLVFIEVFKEFVRSREMMTRRIGSPRGA